MAILSAQEATEVLKASKNKEIARCVEHDNRVSFHAEPHDHNEDIAYLGTYKKWVRNMIDDNKYAVFEHLLQLPVETVDFVEGIYNEIGKIFTAKDRYIKHAFKTDETAQEFEEYLQELKDESFWREQGYEALKTSINSVLIVDLPAADEGAEAKPYYYFLDIDRVHDFKLKGSKFEYIAFSTDNVWYVFDELFYRTFTKDEHGNYLLASEVEHILGETPARMFWDKKYSKKSAIRRRSIISNALGKLDWLLTLQVFKKHESLYAGFPVDIMYEQRCDYMDSEGNACEDGRITKQVRDLTTDDYLTSVDMCPRCGGNVNKLGAGTVMIAPARIDQKDPDMINGLNRVSADVKSLEWIQDEIDKEKKIITWNIIGYQQEQNNEAMNEMQVAGNYESRMTVIIDIKTSFEKIHAWAVNSVGRLRYGDAYEGSTVFYGREFYLQDVGVMADQLGKSKTNGLPVFEVVSQHEQYLRAKYQHNPEMLERMRILSDLEPYQGYSVEELTKMGGAVNVDLLKMKINLSEHIGRFEREYQNIATFMQHVEYRKKIEFIKTKITDYERERETNEPQPDPSATGGNQVQTGTRTED